VSFDPERPYNDLPDLPPPVELETKAVLKRTIAATRALADLKAIGGAIPDQSILINSVVLQEARASSGIENIVTTSDELYRALDEGSAGATRGAKEVLRYREALWHGFSRLRERPFSTNLAVELLGIIRGTDAGIRKVPGTRTAAADGAIIYTPPEGEALIRAKLANLERFAHADNGLDPLVRLAVMHYQFEAIHPFTDGNGRTGRILNTLYLVERGLLGLPVLFMSQYILAHRAENYRLLRSVTERRAWEDWILYMLDAIEVTASDTRQRILDIRALMETTLQRATSAGARVARSEVIEAVFRLPYCRIAFLVAAGIAKRETASRYLRELESLGVLVATRIGRDTYFVNSALVAILERPAFAPGS